MARASLDGNLVRTGRLLEDALRALGARPDPARLESMAVLVHETMAARGRSFHNIGHVFDAAEGAGPRVALAAAFHDTIYLQVDGGLSPRVESVLAGSYERRGADVLLPPPGHDRTLALVHGIFALPLLTPVAPTCGLNEMLSAVLAVRTLSDLLPEKELVRVAAGIEATIPFRAASPLGVGPADLLRDRLEALADELSLGLCAVELDEAVADSVRLANRDVANFASEDPAGFLDNTWALLPETNWSLRLRSAYTIREYRDALLRMEGFLSRLDPKLVFRAWRGTPDEAEYASMVARARRNVEVAAGYLEAKLVAACLLDAFAGLTGGDAPVALFMGDLPSGDEEPRRMEAYLQSATSPSGPERDSEVWRLLSAGRTHPVGFDLKNAPLAAFLFAALGVDGIRRARNRSRTFSAGEIGPREYLVGFEAPSTLATVARACAQVAYFRTEGLEALAASLG